jgi:predicted permease
MKLLRRIAALFRKEKLDREMSEELRAHVELQIRENIARGMPPDDARYASLRAFGGVEQIKERCREQRSWVWLDQLVQDVRYAVRSLRRNPVFTFVAVLTLALGIGANTAIFSVVRSVMLKPLDYAAPERLVAVLHPGAGPVSPADFLDWRNQSRSFAGMAAAEYWGGTLTGDTRAESIVGIRYGDGMFDVLGVRPVLGRGFQAGDFVSGRDRVLVLGYGIWQRRFGGDAEIMGRTVMLSGEPYTVIGVMPEGFQFAPFWATRAEFAAPLDLAQRSTARSGNSLRVFARLKPGVSLEQARAEMDTLSRQLEQTYPQTNTGRTVRVTSLLEQTVGNVRASLQLLSGAVVFVLLIACVNVANLQLARASSRQKEMAVRTALGASRGRTIRQLLTESVVLAGAGGSVGLLLGYAGVAGLKALLATDAALTRLRMPRVAEISVDAHTLLFTLGLALLTGLAFGLVPAWQAARSAQRDALQEGARGTTGGRRGQRMRSALVVTEIALALITLIGAGLLLRSFARMTALDPGFEPRNGVTMVVSLHGQRELTGAKREAFYDELNGAIRALPGVVTASAVNHLPLGTGDLWTRSVAIDGRPRPKPGQAIMVAYRVCMPGYFEAAGIRLLRGRDFTAQDRPESPGAVVINDALARRHWPNEDPIGRRITLDGASANPRWFTIVGVVETVKVGNWTEAPTSEIYLPFAQTPYFSEAARQYTAMTLVIRTAVDPLAIVAPVQNAVARLNPAAPVSAVASLDQVVASALWQPRFHVLLTGLFASVALVLAAIGLYGVLGYAVSQRTREIGVRLALGASARSVLGLTLGQGMKLASIGVVCGSLGALGLTRIVANLLYEVEPTDPWTFTGVSLLLLVVAAVACWIPARRAANVDPMVALRTE